jgi:hypothetical protein
VSNLLDCSCFCRENKRATGEKEWFFGVLSGSGFRIQQWNGVTDATLVCDVAISPFSNHVMVARNF